MRTLASIAIDALSYGMVLFVITIGLSITMGLMRIVNLAHGAFAMIGGYIASYAMHDLGFGYVAAMTAAIAGTSVLAAPIERLFYRRIYGASDVPQVLMTIGITFAVVGLANLALGPTLKTVPLPEALTRPIDLGFTTVAAHRLVVIAVGAILALGLWILVDRTAFGIQLRAAIDDPPMAAALGIRTDMLYSATFALAVGLAALGGVIGAELLPLEPYYALRTMVTFLVVICVAGAGSIPGALASSLLLGTVDAGAHYLAPEFGEFSFYCAVIVLVFLFPRGLFAKTAL